MKRNSTFNFLRPALLLILMACAAPPNDHSEALRHTLIDPGADEVYAENPYNFKILMSSQAREDAQKVVVNIKRMEFFLRGQNVEGLEKRVRLAMGEGLGFLDLLTLRDGVMLPVDEARLAPGVEVHQIRLVLEEFGNYLIKEDGSLCLLQTPSGQQSGVKIILQESLVIEDGSTYSIVVDFDAKRSVVHQGNGGCLLKPVIKVRSISKIPSGEPGNGDSDLGDEEVLVEDGDENSPDNDGYEDPSDAPENWGPVVDDDELQPIF